MGDLSAHFSEAEFRCHGFGQHGHPSHPTIVSRDLLNRLEGLRADVGRPLRIVSGHRCAWWNDRVHGAASSQHLDGRAADIPSGYATVGRAARHGFGGIGDRAGWAVHVDVRPGYGRWHY